MTQLKTLKDLELIHHQEYLKMKFDDLTTNLNVWDKSREIFLNIQRQKVIKWIKEIFELKGNAQKNVNELKLPLSSLIAHNHSYYKGMAQGFIDFFDITDEELK